MNKQEKIRNLYLEADKKLRLKQSIIGCILVLILIPAGISLDYFVYPEHLTSFTLLRIGTDAAILVILALHFSAIGKSHIRVLTFSWLALTSAMISYMVFLSAGHASPYYAGLALTIVAIGILLPMTMVEVAAFCAMTIGMYLFAALYQVTDLNFSILYNNVYFLVLAAIVSLTSVHFNNKRRFKEFELNFELNIRNQELAELDRLKSQFFANVSHELRTPLTLILSPIQELVELRRDVPESIREPLRIAQSNAYRLLRLVNNLLDIMRLEEGPDNLTRGPVELNRIVADQADGLAHIAAAKGVRLEHALHQKPLVIAGDTGALERIVVNLLNNAVKFTERGSWVRVTTQREGDQAAIVVADGGVGIATGELPYIFDRFRQADGSSTRRYQGTGLGLSLVKTLVGELGGAVTAESTPDVGSTFRVTLPLLDGDDLVTRSLGDPAEASPNDELEALHQRAARYVTGSDEWEEPPSSGMLSVGEEERGDEPPLVLVIEDDDSMRRYLKRVMADEGFRVTLAADGEVGIRSAIEQQPALILLDLMMPRVDGFEVTRRLRRETSLSNTRIILMTAKEGKQVQVQALEEGADDFVPKPFMLPELRARIRNLVERYRLFNEVEAKNHQLSETLNKLHRTQAQLIHSEKLNALGSLSAGLLHEITNPLNFATMAISVLKGDPAVMEDEDRREVIADIEDGMARIDQIVTDLGTFAHPSGEGLEATFSIDKAVRVAVRSTSKEAEGINVVTEMAGSCIAKGAQSHIIQVLINLITNASKAIREANREEERTIRVTCESVGKSLRLSVWDNGTGIPPDRLSRVFDPFFTTREVGDGMGMGLSVSHTIVENHGSELRVESVWGEWTRFSFDLPIGD